MKRKATRALSSRAKRVKRTPMYRSLKPEMKWSDTNAFNTLTNDDVGSSLRVLYQSPTNTIAQGVGNAQRIGNKICGKFLEVRWDFQTVLAAGNLDNGVNLLVYVNLDGGSIPGALEPYDKVPQERKYILHDELIPLDTSRASGVRNIPLNNLPVLYDGSAGSTAIRNELTVALRTKYDTTPPSAGGMLLATRFYYLDA